MYELLVTDYALDIKDTTTISDRHCFCDERYAYFTTCIEDREAIFIEQAVLAIFLKENGCRGMAWPIRNNDGDWHTVYKGKRYLVCCTEVEYFSDDYSSGELLAHFHKRFSHYPYQPKNVSCYGEWKELWIDKLEYFEETIGQFASQRRDPFACRVMDLFSYLIGMSENAIQYIGESEMEVRFGESDQPAITFVRYQEQLRDPVIWPDDLLYDHPVRDVAEWLRTKFLEPGAHVPMEASQFLADYESVQPLSIFGWRLLYARLLYPAHFFDLLEQLFETENEEKREGIMDQLNRLCVKQELYEVRLKNFFETANVNPKQYRIPQPEWLT